MAINYTHKSVMTRHSSTSRGVFAMVTHVQSNDSHPKVSRIEPYTNPHPYIEEDMQSASIYKGRCVCGGEAVTSLFMLKKNH